MFKPLDFTKTSVRLEAEDTRFYGGRSQDKLKGFSGKSYAIGENHAYSKFRIIWNVDIACKDEYKVMVKYMNYSNSDLNYKINGIPVVLKCATSGESKWNNVSIILPLNNGRQKIDFAAPNSSSNEVALDCIELSKIVK